MVIIESLRKQYGRTIACDIKRLTFNDGEIIGLVGNNGAGKTTLFRLMLDLTNADNGKVSLTSPSLPRRPDSTPVRINVAGSEDWKLFTGAYLDESFLIDYLTPEEYFEFVARLSCADRKTATEQLSGKSSWLDGCGIIGSGKLIRELSACNRQKIGITAALLHTPSTVILDEPFNFLDPQSQARLINLLKDYNRQTGATIIVSSHNLANIAEICTRIILMENGTIINDIPNNGDTASSILHDYFQDSRQ